jgi:hypothetical protein
VGEVTLAHRLIWKELVARVVHEWAHQVTAESARSSSRLRNENEWLCRCRDGLFAGGDELV